MEVIGNIIQVLPLVTGEGANGTWKKQEFVVETEGQYPRKICLNMWGDKINENLIVVGTAVTASIELSSREYNGRWYTDVRAWKLEVAGAAPVGGAPAPVAAAPATAPAAGAPAAAPVTIPAAMEGEDDLPF